VRDPNYDITEVLKITLPNTKLFDLSIKFMDDTQSSTSMWAIDGMLIDEELLYAEDEEADRIYQELKQRSFRRRTMEEKENRLTMQMKEEYEPEEDFQKES
jgi:hypothetical protein